MDNDYQIEKTTKGEKKFGKVGKIFHSIISITIIFLTVFQIQLIAQNKNTTPTNFPESKFKHLTIEDGLSQNGAFAIEQDSKGFIWVGTKDGLNKYDGYSFSVYTHDPYDSTTISSNYIGAIFEDSRGILWVITSDGEINLMDGKTEVFHKIPLNIQYMTSITEDREGNIWIGTFRSGLYQIERKDILTSNFQFTNYKHHPDEPNSISDNNVFSIAVDNDGVLWIGTNIGLDKLSANTEKRFEHYFINKTAPADKIDNRISAVLNNSDSTLWLGSPLGVILFNKNNGIFKLYPYGNGVAKNKYGSGIINDIVKDRVGNLWMHSAGYLVSFNVYDKTYNYVDRDILPAISKVVVDKAGNIWIGTGYGIYIYFPESNWFKSFPNKQYKNPVESHLSIRAIFEDSHNNLWFSSYNYIYKWNRKTNGLTSYGDPLDVKEFGSTGASSITEDRNGNLWFTTYEGLYRLNTKTNERTHFKINPHPYQAAYGVFEDRSGSIWVVTEEYLSKLTDIQKSQFVHYRYKNRPVAGFDVGASVIYEDERGDLWFTTNMGLIKFNPGNEKFTIYSNDPGNNKSIYSNIIKCIFPDPLAPGKKLWIGTSGGGLNLFDKRTESFTHIMEKDGLPNNVVYGILPDEEGNLWLSTNKGLSNYNPVTKQFINYDVTDGLQNYEFNTGAFFKSKSGELFFGGISGFNYFYPQQIVKKDFTPNIVFTDFKLFNKSVSVRDDNSILKKIISETNEIILSHKESLISFEFASLDYYGTAKNKYSFKLEGFNKDWIQLGAKREVTFTNLDPGDYVLRIKEMNSDGIWNEEGASLNIIITPPIWASWWAYGLYVIVIGSILFGIRKYEMNRINWKNQSKLDIVKLKEREETDKMKSRFFANISHEFRTPLTLILGPSENIIIEAPNDNIKKQAGAIKRNANRLLGLINQLLDLSKLEAGKLELKTSKANIVSFIKGVTMSFESVAEAKDITLKVKAPNDEIELYFDKEKMTKIMTNLLSNAFQFTQEGGEISVTVTSRHAELVSASASSGKIPKQVRNNVMKDSILIKVIDTGVGISEEEIPKLFDRFYQVDSSQTREHEGTGIGLALTKELVELHHGTISVDSKLGDPDEVGTGWTEFRIELPLGSAHLKDDEIVDHQKTEQPKDVILIPLRREKNLVIESEDSIEVETEDKTLILIVEDNADVREYIKDSLSKDFQIEEASNGEQGVRKAEKIIPDLILSDIMMPKMDGNELTRILKNDEKTSHIPIILLTAKSEQQSKLEGLETGADDYLTKPFDTKELQIRIKNLINSRRELQKKYSGENYVPVKKRDEKKLSNLEEKFMCKVMEVIEIHLSEEEFSIEQFGKEVGMSRVQLHRKLKALSGKSASNYLRSVRLSKAKKMIEEQKGNISEISYSVGFSSPAYFTRCFKEEYGYPPSEVAT